MGISVTCGHCAASYTVRDELAGKKVRCKQCSQAVAVPAANAMYVDDPLEMTAEEYAASLGKLAPRAGGLKQAQARTSSMKRTGGDAYLLDGESGAAAAEGPMWEKYEQRKAPREPYTALLIMVHFAVAVGAAVRILTNPTVSSADISSYVITRIVGTFIGCFALAAPLVLLGVYASAKLFKRDMPRSAYVKAAGAASMLFILFNAGLLLMPLPGSSLSFLTPQLITIGKFLGIGLFIAALVYAFGLGPFSGAISAILCLIAFGIVLSSAHRGLDELQRIAAHPGVVAKVEAEKRGSAVARVQSAGAAVDPKDIESNKVRNDFSALVNRIEFEPREKLEAELVDLEKRAVELKSHARAADLPQLAVEVRQKMRMAAPQTPPDSIFQAEASANKWTADAESPAALGDEVSFRNFKVRPPKGALVDLTSSEESAGGLAWFSGQSGQTTIFTPTDALRAKMSIRRAERTNPRQVRPWVVSKPFQAKRAEAEYLLTVDGAGTEVTYGVINGIDFTRVMTSGAGGSRSIKYFGVEGGQWLIVEIAAPVALREAGELFDHSVRTVRRAGGSEPRVDPFSLPVLVQRLYDSPKDAAILLKRHGAAAEDAVTPMLNSNDPLEQRAALAALAEVGTTRSLRTLQRLARSPDASLRDASRLAGKRIDPKGMDDVACAVMDLEMPDNARLQPAALRVLSKARADERRIRIAPHLENILLGKTEGALFEESADALIVWATPRTAQNIAAVLKDENCSPHARRAVMRVLGQLKDPGTARAVTNWLVLDAETAETTLIAMGAVAEDEVLWQLKNAPADKARTGVVRVLEQIGTRKSLGALQLASNDARHPEAAAAAKKALEVVKQRAGTGTAGGR